MRSRSFAALLAGSLFAVGVAVSSPSVGAATAAGDESLPRSTNILTWTPEEQLSGYRNMDRLFATRRVSASSRPYPLPEKPRDLSGVRYTIEGETFDLEGFLEHNRVTGLLVIQDGEVVTERYRHGNGPDTKWVSFSIAKSVVSMLVGAAIRDGYIRGVDDLVTDYLPLLEGSSYDGVTIRHVLRMASGVEWNEDYDDPRSDVARSRGTALERLRYLASKPRVAEPGERFNYNTAETHLAGAVLRSAIGNNLATYLENEIWRPFGMESDANWMLVEPGGPEHGGCCLSATLRDYGRIGLFALRGGVLADGTEVLADGWMEESTEPSPAYDGYGYLWWLRDAGFWAIGIFGQLIAIDPASDLVIVTHSAWPRAVGEELSEHRAAFVAAVAEALRE